MTDRDASDVIHKLNGQKQQQQPSQAGGLLGKVLLPGFADAGANASFQKFRPIDPAPHNNNIDTSDNTSSGDEQNSEATTTIRDNRTAAIKRHFSRYRNNANGQQLPQQQQQQESKYGFFPSTKPPHTSPRPPSPPTVTRRQLPVSKASSVAGTSVVPETGGAFEVQLESIRSFSEKEKTPLRRPQHETDEQPANHNNDGDEPTESTHSRSTDNSSTGRGNQYRETSLLEDEDDDDRISEVASEVLSTASEMGTVINVGSSRMAEIDAMAALIEASPAYGLEELHPSSPGAPLHSDLSLPILESQSFDQALSSLPKSTLKQSTSLEKNLNLATTRGDAFRERTFTNNPTTSEMVSKAIRRIGSGLNNNKSNNKDTSYSAPPTPKTPAVQPPSVEDLLKSTLTPRSNSGAPPASFALRSPGSSARQAVPKKTTLLTPRFNSSAISATSPSWLQQQVSTPRSMDYVAKLDNNDDDSDDDDTNKLLMPQPSNNNNTNILLSKPSPTSMLGPFRLAQKCFSFDSTLDDQRHDGGKVNILPRVDERKIPYSQSWDVGGGTTGWVDDGGRAPAFQSNPHRLVGGPVLRNTRSQEEQARARVDSDFSPTKLINPQTTTSIIELQTPQRIEIEREDALDILACLVERGVSDWRPTTTITNNAHNVVGDETHSETSTSESLVASVAEELRKMSSSEEKDPAKNAANTEDGESQTNHSHSKRMQGLDELVRAHAYALEMKRASLSAASWLKSIGRFDGSTENTDRVVVPASSSSSSAAAGGQTSGEAAANDDGKQVSTTDQATKMELVTMHARLHRAEMELKEKTEANEKLNLELSKCRAEIGRLKTQSRNESQNLHGTPNRSILDDEDSSSAAGSRGRTPKSHPSPIPNGVDSFDDKLLFEESFNGNNSIFQAMPEHDTTRQQQQQQHRSIIHNETEQLDVMVMKAALEEANATIRRLHGEIHKEEKTDGSETLAPIVDVPELATSEETKKVMETSHASDFHRTVNVRMLDGENFVTEWDDLTPPLPPPPDHGLRSPIVGAVLEQWTNDRSLHESLIAWIDRVMTGNDIDSSVPPLTISSLDHQVRDGFTMHVLPLLLRRADIHVAVQTRAHRTTKYDMAVTVSQKSLLQSPAALSHHQHAASLLDHYVGEEWLQTMAAESHMPSSAASVAGSSAAPCSVAHSAVTEKVINTSGAYSTQFRNHPAEVEQYSHFGIQHSASGEFDEHQPGIMSALGGALGGLLSRRKFSAEATSPSRGAAFYHNDAVRSSMPAELRAQLDLTSSPIHNSFPKEEEQPYHRVVSAPPGRIGVTFVEFRGHAMVSDVAPDSPLSSWVFPSDILIAIDEVPVSGMRVRDIIKVLTSRRGRQRALRVISSHAMNEFTLNSSALNEMQDTD